MRELVVCGPDERDDRHREERPRAADDARVRSRERCRNQVPGAVGDVSPAELQNANGEYTARSADEVGVTILTQR